MEGELLAGALGDRASTRRARSVSPAERDTIAEVRTEADVHHMRTSWEHDVLMIITRAPWILFAATGA